MQSTAERKEAFPPGCRVRLVRLAEDGGFQETLQSGEEGTVQHVDSMGTVHVLWDDGRSLGALPEDIIVRI